MTTAETFSQYVLPTYGRFPIIPEKAQGCYLWDSEGKRYLDFCTGIAVCSIGHCHPRLTKAVQKQAETLMHCSNLYQIPQQAELAKLIVEDFVNIPGKVFFSNSGAEANDGLIKLARRFGHYKTAPDGSARGEVITFNKSFHGRTLGAMAATGNPSIQEGFAPLLEGFVHAELNDIEGVKALINEKTCAILLEPLQGEGGVNEVKSDFLRALRQLCDEHDLLLMFDEVQAGFGRLGHGMAWRALAPEIEPDAISWAKGIGGGFPIGAFFASDRAVDEKGTSLSSLLGAKSHGSTYGGNPMACAAAIAVLEEIKESNLADNAAKLGAYMKQKVAEWNVPHVSHLKGDGLMLGLQLNADAFTLTEGQTPALALCIALNEAGLLTVPAGAETLRLLPPLNVTQEEVDEAFALILDTLKSL